ncbi:MAG: GNAT family N-acetyltransferase [Actinobacteria bacterium]|nr:GNAT family N-acetyltransferase [Actinomycetota bacterium]
MKLSVDLEELRSDSQQPMAPKTGPFAQSAFLTAWHAELGEGAQVLVASWESGQLAMMKRGDGLVELLGEPDLSDYHSPLGELTAADFAMLADDLSDQRRILFDSLPAEVSRPIATGLADAGLAPATSQHQSALVLQLPASVDDFYQGLGKKDRHELRRKRRRYEDSIGKVVLRTHEGADEGFDEFVRLHRLATGAKGQFMTGARERFFRRLAAQPGWRTDLLETPAGTAACLFGYADGRDYYLYNSSFDPALAAGSPGLVVLMAMIEHAIEMGYEAFDFLKGDEDYKLRLGAVRRPLFVIEAELPSP